MHVNVLPKKTLTDFHSEKVIVFPLLSTLMLNIRKEIRIVKIPSPIAPLVNVTIRKRSLAIRTIGTNWYEWKAPQPVGI